MGVRKERSYVRKYFNNIYNSISFVNYLRYFNNKVNDSLLLTEFFTIELEKTNLNDKEIDRMIPMLINNFYYLLNKATNKKLKMMEKKGINVRNRNEDFYIILKFMFLNDLLSYSNFKKMLDLNLYFHDEISLLILSAFKNKSSLYFVYLNYLTEKKYDWLHYKFKKMVKEYLLKQYIMSSQKYNEYYPKIIKSLNLKENDLKKINPEKKWDTLIKTSYPEKIKEFFIENPEQGNSKNKNVFVNYFLRSLNIYDVRNLNINNLFLIIDLCSLDLEEISQINRNIKKSYEEKIISEERMRMLSNEIIRIFIKKEDILLKGEIKISSQNAEEVLKKRM